MREAAGNTPGAPDVAMEFDHVAGSGFLMQAVYILRNEGELRKAILPAGNLVVRGIGQEDFQKVATIIEPLPHCGQVSFEHFSRGDHVEGHSLPDRCIASTAKCRDA